MIEVVAPAMSRFVIGPTFGRQHLGHPPGGAGDRFSFRTGNVLLGNQRDARALEIGPLAPTLRFTQSAMFTLVGARRRAWLGERPIEHAEVVQAAAGDVLRFGQIEYGNWSYLCLSETMRAERVGLRRGSFASIATWPDPAGRLRVLRGPESDLIDPGLLIIQPWRVDPASSDIGLRLTGPNTPSLPQLISQPVVDGTVQLTPTGLIVLLRRRPTIGGYPRVGVVVDADVDLLAQHRPGESVRFMWVEHETAAMVRDQQSNDLDRLASRSASTD